jgi:hypothetical protein
MQFLNAYSPSNIFAAQEFEALISALGIEYPSEKLQLYSFCHEIRRLSIVNPTSNLNRRTSGALLLRPVRSGFFSVIENIIAAQFVAYENGYDLILSPESDWWPYEIAFSDLTESLFQPKNVASPVGIINFDAMRAYAMDLNIEKLGRFGAFKQSRYFALRELLARKFNSTQSPSFEHYYYLRGGDKVANETVALPTEVVSTALLKCVETQSPIGVLSDDHHAAERLCEMMGPDRARNLTSSEFSGHFLDNAVSEADVRAIVENFLLLSASRTLLSCPTSNLVNAAHWANSATRHQISAQSVVPRYFLF